MGKGGRKRRARRKKGANHGKSTTINGRQVALVVAELSGPYDVFLTWTEHTGAHQTSDGTVSVTPSVVPGDKSSNIKTSCEK